MKSPSRVRLFVTPWTYQAPPSVGFSRQEYWSGLPFPSPGDLPDPGIEPGSSALEADALTSEPPGKQNPGLLHSKQILYHLSHQELKKALLPPIGNQIPVSHMTGGNALHSTDKDAKSFQSCPTLCTPLDCSAPGSSVPGLLQARILEWVIRPSSRGSSQYGDQPCVTCIFCVGRQALHH